MVGHSLGSAVTLQLQKDFPKRDLRTVAYAAPVVSSFTEKPKDKRYRQYGDPISLFDRGAESTVPEGDEFYNPHSYSSVGSRRVTGQRELRRESAVPQVGPAGAGVEGARSLVE